jgi:hypothetical protein
LEEILHWFLGNWWESSQILLTFQTFEMFNARSTTAIADPEEECGVFRNGFVREMFLRIGKRTRRG